MPHAVAAVAARFMLAAICIAPFMVSLHPYPIPTFIPEALAASLGLAFAASLLIARAASPGVPQLALPWIALAAVLVVQVLIGKFVYRANVELAALQCVWAALLVWAGASFVQRFGRATMVRTLAWSLALGGMLAAVPAFVQIYNPAGSFFDGLVMRAGNGFASSRAYGNLGQPNLLASYLALGLAALGYLYAIGRLGVMPVVLVALWLIGAITLTGSRMPFLFAIAFVVLACAWVARDRTEEARRSAGFALAVLLLLAVMVPLLDMLGLGPGAESAFRRSDDLAGGGSSAVRLHLWRHAAAMFADAPLLGHGFGSYAERYLAQSSTMPTYGVTGFDRHAHNIVLQLAAETGVAGLACLAALVVLMLRAWLALPRGPERVWIGMSLAVLGIHSLLEYPLWLMHFLAIAALLIGAIERRPLALSMPRMAPVLATIAIAWGALTIGQTVHIWTTMRALVHPVVFHAFVSQDEDLIDAAARRVQGTIFEPYLDVRIALYARPDAQGNDALARYVERAAAFWPAVSLILRAAELRAESGQLDAAARLIAAATAISERDVRDLQGKLPPDNAIRRLIDQALARSADRRQPLERSS